MRLTRTFGAAGALILAALVGGTLIGAVAAAPPEGEAAGGHCDAYREAFATNLGVSVDALTPAAQAAAASTVEAAVAAGDITTEMGDQIKERIEASEGDGCRILAGAWHRAVRHADRAEFKHDLGLAAADALGLSVDELRDQLRSGESLIDVAATQGVDYAVVSAAVLDAATADLIAAVEAGKITQERADAMLERLEAHLAEGGFGPGGHQSPGE